jgi:PadR family transcriptional regulator, regulatory protein PadR
MDGPLGNYFYRICNPGNFRRYFFYKIPTNEFICLTNYIQMSKEYLGEFEELVLTMVIVLGEEAYGNAIVSEIKARMQREVNLSAVHVTLYRLEDKGMVKSKMGGATNSRGGRRKRQFVVTNAGLALLRNLKEAREDLWKLIPQLQMHGI